MDDLTNIKSRKPLVLGIGNTLLSDEGVGVHVVDYLEKHGLSSYGIDSLDGGTLGFTLAQNIEDTDYLIVVDAARMHVPPGSVRSFVGPDFDQYLGKGKLSAHEIGLADLMDIALICGGLPHHRALVGVEPEDIGWGEVPCDRVKKAIPVAAMAVVEILSKWGVLTEESRHFLQRVQA